MEIFEKINKDMKGKEDKVMEIEEVAQTNNIP